LSQKATRRVRIHSPQRPTPTLDAAKHEARRRGSARERATLQAVVRSQAQHDGAEPPGAEFGRDSWRPQAFEKQPAADERAEGQRSQADVDVRAGTSAFERELFDGFEWEDTHRAGGSPAEPSALDFE